MKREGRKDEREREDPANNIPADNVDCALKTNAGVFKLKNNHIQGTSKIPFHGSVNKM